MSTDPRDESRERADDARYAEWLDEDRRDLLADHAPAPPPPPSSEEHLAFLGAAKRGCEIFAGADVPQTGTLARAVGARLVTVLDIADSLKKDITLAHQGDDVSDGARELVADADLLLVGILIGRELPR